MKFSKYLTSIAALSCGLFLTGVNSIHFYLNGSETKCFIEDLPNDTVVVGKFKAEGYIEESQTYQESQKYTVSIDVIEKNTGNLVVTQKLKTSGQFTFTTHEYGEHRLCIAVGNPDGGWFHNYKIKFSLNLFIGSDAIDEKYMPDKVTKLQDRIHVVNSWLHDILYEQEYQREKEHQFLSLSESINSKLTYWIILQIAVMVGVCYWQVTHLRRFFVTKKLV
ncbi:hypothetical protein K502DRAFT_316684 [Neoconidiobolus thromboides FSU 785]|nr:hypothetical protein K502DRAFT_316684 [Neoconidiobolus thromboides FSU 785]